MKWRDSMAPAGVCAHETTTRHAGAIYPFLFETGRRIPGVVVGVELSGGTFSFDPFTLYASGVLSNPNMVVFGQIGRGKSSFVKTMIYRQLTFGRGAYVIDPKGEYSALGHACGVTPLALRPGGPLRLNPLDLVGDDIHEGAVRRLQLLESLVSSSLGRDLFSRERSALELALHDVQQSTNTATLPLVSNALLQPSAESARSIYSSQEQLCDDGREVGLELRRLVTGDLKGLFDAETSSSLDLDQRLVILDLSALYGSEALGLFMVCATAWVQQLLQRQRNAGRQSLLVVDEAWAILTAVAVARWLQSSWKLARAWGVSNIAVLHRVSDLKGVGSDGSEQQGLAQGLLLDSETRVIYAQPTGEVDAARDLLHLNETERSLLVKLPRGVALWKVGNNSSIVRHLVGQRERQIVDTDGAMG